MDTINKKQLRTLRNNTSMLIRRGDNKENMENMDNTQGITLMDKYYKAMKEHYQNIIIDSSGFGFDINSRALYLYVYGHDPVYQYHLTSPKDVDAFRLIDNSLETTSIDDEFDELIKKNYSFRDTVNKIGCKARPTSRSAILFTDKGMLELNSYGNTIGDSDIKKLESVHVFTDDRNNTEYFTELIANNLVKVELEKKDMSSYIWVKTGYGGGSLTTQTLEFKKMEVDIKKNYNDDLPYDDIIDTLNSDKNELILFNGEAGTGKSTLIKHLIGKMSDKDFLYIDSNLLHGISSSSFISFLLEYRNSIVVLEDCEKILSKREEGNPFMGTLLNLTDGIIGETVNAKFICSFNCSERKIDEALLRKGRLSLKYTFNKLDLEKTKAFIPDATKPMTLADIYNNGKNNVANKPEEKKIGF